MQKERGAAEWLLIVIGIILALIIIGFFRSDSSSILRSFTIKKFLNLECGLTVESPEENLKVLFPHKVSGYVNGCGWNLVDGSVGTVQVFDATGAPVTKPGVLVVTKDSISEPYFFEGVVTVYQPPKTDTGRFVFTSTSGLLAIIPVQF